MGGSESSEGRKKEEERKDEGKDDGKPKKKKQRKRKEEEGEEDYLQEDNNGIQSYNASVSLFDQNDPLSRSKEPKLQQGRMPQTFSLFFYVLFLWSDSGFSGRYASYFRGKLAYESGRRYTILSF